jgi:hypothetical protein
MPNDFLGIINAINRVVERLDKMAYSVGGNPIGAYAGGTTYQKGDIVSYGTASYIAKIQTVGHLPTDTTYWVKLAG